MSHSNAIKVNAIKVRHAVGVILGMCVLLTVLAGHWTQAQNQRPDQSPPPPPTLGLDQGYLEFDTPDFQLKLVKASQTIAALQPHGPGGFDFTPADRLEVRARNGYHHIGDLILRFRSGDNTWPTFDTADNRSPVVPVTRPGTLATADLMSTLPADCPLTITRSWSLHDKHLVLSFEVKNKTVKPVEIGALSIPLVFNNI